MKRKQRSKFPAKVKAVRTRIERWRRTRKKRTQMPEDLWTAAVGLARVHGVYGMSQALTVNYETLRRRTTDSRKPKGTRRSGTTAGFIELDAGQFVGTPDPTGTVVELVDRDGAKLTIRFPGSRQVDFEGLANWFWGRGR